MKVDKYLVLNVVPSSAAISQCKNHCNYRRTQNIVCGAILCITTRRRRHIHPDRNVIHALEIYAMLLGVPICSLMGLPHPFPNQRLRCSGVQIDVLLSLSSSGNPPKGKHMRQCQWEQYTTTEVSMLRRIWREALSVLWRQPPINAIIEPPLPL